MCETYTPSNQNIKLPIFRKITMILILYNIFQMSLIIDLPEASLPNDRHQVTMMLTSIFRTHPFQCRNVSQNGKQATFWLRASQNAFSLSTSWRFQMGDQNLRIEICIYNMNDDDLLRASSDRMKVELFILLRAINAQLRLFFPSLLFIIDTETGALKLLELIPQFFNFKLDKQAIQSIIFKLLQILRRHQDICTFLQPLCNFKEPSQEQLLSHPNNRINRLRCLLENTPNRRSLINNSLFELVQRRALNQQFTHHFMNISNFYMMNVLDLKLSQLGLEQVDYDLDRKIFAAELDEKERHEKAKASAQNKQLDKILYGIVKINPSKKFDQDKDQNANQQGAHSQIKCKTFEYYVADTIYAGTVNEHMSHQQTIGKKKEGRLTYKVCNTETEASVNSFKNELAFLRHVRDMANPYIARYFLLVKESWDERDTIYMTTYQQNVYSLVTNRKTLGVRAKLQLAYRITKSLCFLFSKKIAHRDFKPQNVVVDSMLTPKLIDFGSCVAHFSPNPAGKKFKPHDERLLSTPNYQVYYSSAVRIDPKIPLKLNKKQYDEHPLFDVYSLGKTLNFIFFGDLDLKNPESVSNWPFPEVMQNLIFLISKCLSVDPDDRPCFGEITSFLSAINELISKVMERQEEESARTEDNPENSEEKKQVKKQKNVQRGMKKQKKQQKNQKAQKIQKVQKVQKIQKIRKKQPDRTQKSKK